MFGWRAGAARIVRRDGFAAGHEPRQAAVQLDAGRLVDRRLRPGVEEFIDHPPLLALVDVVHLHDHFADLLGLLRRQLIEHRVAGVGVEAGHEDGRLAKPFAGKFHGHHAPP